MKGEKLFMVILLYVLVASMAYAELEISDVEYERNGRIVTVVSTENPRLADLTFRLQESEGKDIVSLTANLLDIQSSEERRTLAINQDEDDNCYGNGASGYSCTIRDIYVKPDSVSGTIPIEAVSGEETLQASLSFDFQRDDENPIVNSISINGCNGQCSIGSGGELQIELDNGPFENGFIFFTIDSRGPYMVRECIDNLCTRQITGSCTHGREVNVKITSSAEGVPSQDDAGNPVNFSQGIMEKNFLCDSRVPEIIDYRIESDDENGYIIKDSRARFIFTIDEESDISGTADLSELTGEAESNASCNQAGEHHECIFEADVSEEGFKRVNAEFTFTDTAGNQIIERKEVEILETGTYSEADYDFWSVRKVEVSPESINRKTLKNYDREVMAAIYLDGPTDADILEQSLIQCSTDQEGISVNEEMQIPGKTSQLKITIPKESWNIEDEAVQVDCTIETTSRVGNVVFQKPEEDDISFMVSLDYWEDVPALIENNLDEFQDDKETLRKVLGNTKKVSNIASGMCRISQILKASQTGVAGSQAAVCGGSRATAVLAPVGEAIGNALRGIQSVLGISADASWAGGGIICNMMTCDYDGILGGLDGVWSRTPGHEYLEDLGFQKEEFLKPEANLGMNLASLCIPGVVSNLEQYQQIGCEYERCMTEDALGYGLPVSSCEQARSVNNCRYITGQTVNSALGLVGGGVVGTLKDWAKDTLTNPFTLVGFAAGQLCQANPECVSNGICIAGSAAATASDIITIRDNIVSVKNSFSQLMSNDVPFCQLSEQVQDPNLRKTLFELWSDGERPQQNLMCDNELGWGGCMTDSYYIDENTEAFLTFKHKDGREGIVIGYDGEYYEATEGEVIDPNPEKPRKLNIDLSKPVDPAEIELGTTLIDMENHFVFLDDPETQSTEMIELDDELRERYDNMQDQKRSLQEAADSQDVKTQKDLAREVKGLSDLKKKIVFGMKVAFQAGNIEDAKIKSREYIDQKCQEFGCDAAELIVKVNNCFDISCESLNEFEDIINEDISQKAAVMKDIAPDIWSAQSVGASIRTGIQLGNLASEVLPEEWHELPWHDQVNSVFDKYLSTDGYTARYCEQKFDVPGTTMSTMPSEPSRVSMHVEAYKRQGEYVLTAYVSPPSSRRISFDIILSGEGTEKVSDNIIVIESGDPAFVRTRENHIIHESGSEFDTVCFEFHDKVQEINGFLSDGKFCNKVVEE